jgi:hypothetical protein
MPQNTKQMPSPSELLAATAAIAAGTQAYSEVIIFNNPAEGEPGHFDWLMSPDEFDPAIWLDISRPSADQGGLVGPRSVGQHGYGYGYPYGPVTRSRTFSGAMVAIVGIFTESFITGATIDGQLNFATDAIHADFVDYGEFGTYVWSQFSEGVPSYMGVRFSDVDGYHYGWIGVIREPEWIDFDAFAWGYETEPGVPIIAGIPAPGTLAALAFGSAVTRRGRKRKES